MDNNIWFYTLSTISQTTAAIIGLFAVFVVFKMDKINKSITDLRGPIIHMISNGESMKYLQISNQQVYSEALKFFEKTPSARSAFGWTSDEVGPITINRDNIYIFKDLIEKKENILSKLKWSIFFCTASIILSIYLLTFSTFFIIYNYIILPTLFIVTFFGIIFTVKNIYEISR